MQQQPEPRIPLFPFIRLWWTAVYCARRRPAPLIAVLVAVVMIAGFGVFAARDPVPGCKWRVVVTEGRVHMVCAEAAR